MSDATEVTQADGIEVVVAECSILVVELERFTFHEALHNIDTPRFRVDRPV